MATRERRPPLRFLWDGHQRQGGTGRSGSPLRRRSSFSLMISDRIWGRTHKLGHGGWPLIQQPAERMRSSPPRMSAYLVSPSSDETPRTPRGRAGYRGLQQPGQHRGPRFVLAPRVSCLCPCGHRGVPALILRASDRNYNAPACSYLQAGASTRGRYATAARMASEEASGVVRPSRSASATGTPCATRQQRLT